MSMLTKGGKHFSVSAAAKIVGIRPATLRSWLRQEGIIVPRVKRGSKALVREIDVFRVVEKRRDARSAF